MKNFFLIVNIGILIFFVYFTSIHSKMTVFAQTPTATTQSTTSNPLDLLKDLLSILFSFSGSTSTPPADFPTPNPSILPNLTPTPFISGLPTQSIQDVIQLVNNIGIHCQGRLTIANIGCLNNFPVQENAKNILIRSVVAYGVEQCGDWAKAMAAMTKGDFWGEIISAMNLIHTQPTGYRFIPKTIGGIQVGDFPVWTYDTFGHTAIVTQVTSATSFQVAEANYDFNGGVRLRDKTMTSDGSDQLAGWLRKL